jgi:fatty-acyl-CoA synthase
MEFNLAQVQEAIGQAIPERECIIQGDRRLTWGHLTERTRRLANFLLSCGLGAGRSQSEVPAWQSGQDHVALYLYNAPEYLEGMLGAFKARTVPFNVNYRYVDKELIYLLNDADARAIVYHACFAPMLESIRPELPRLQTFIQVEDDSRNPLLSGATEYEQALASSSPERPQLAWSPDDLYILYTGGTTGMPKGVLWRQADIFVTALGGRRWDGSEFETLEELGERARTGSLRTLLAPPLMHGAAHWAAFVNLHGGHSVVIQSHTRRFDPDDLLATIEREQVMCLLIVGDAFGRALLEQLRRGRYSVPSLTLLANGGAPLSTVLKQELLDFLPQLSILDTVGASETGPQAQHLSSPETGASTGTFEPRPGCCILSDDLARVLAPGHEEMGWLAQSSRVPLGYLGDAEKTKRSFPVIGGVRYAVPGDRARLRSDGIIELYGRDATMINSGGEKVFAEEVEEALRHHPAVYDAAVVGRPSERWGQEVVALVRLKQGEQATEAELVQACHRQLARYKLPKAILFRDEIARYPTGKIDYRWASKQVS